MPNDLIVRILGDASGFERTLKASTATATGFERTLKKTAVTAEESARAQVSASVRKDERLRSEIATYRAVAAAAEKGSQEQIVAANLADRAQARLAHSMGVTAAESRRLSASTRTVERDLSHAARGIISGSGIFRSLGRSLAFASGGFLAFGSASAFLRKSIDAARDAQVANRQLSQQLENSGRSFGDYRDQIEKTTLRLSALSGIENDELKAGLTTILRTTPNVGKALRDLGTAADLARAKHVGLGKAAQDIARAEGGNLAALRRTLPVFGRHATVEEALARVRVAVAGQARAGATEQERFGAVLHNTEEIIGTGVLPTLNRYLASGSLWLEQMNESGKLQRDVATAAHGFETAVHDVADVVKTADELTGSFKHTLELLIALRLAATAAGWVSAFRNTGTAAKVAAGETAGLSTSLTGLGAIQLAPIVIPIAIAVESGAETKIRSTFGHVAADVFSAVENLASGGATGRSIPQQIGDAIFGHKKKIEVPFPDVGFRAPRVGDLLKEAGAAMDTSGATAGLKLTATQRNTFFDNAISRILLRGGLGGIQQHTRALEQADTLIRQRIAKTKDVTRRLNLEDQLLQNEAQLRSLNAQRAAEAAGQRNTFFDNAIARILLRGGLGGIAQQTRALEQADALIRQRIAVTKDVTRRQNLEDELLQNQADLRARRAEAVGRRNTFFDNAISRILLRGGLGDIATHIAALQHADALIRQRIAVTKDVTRRQNLEDQLLQNEADVRSSRAQQAADAVAKADAAHQKVLDALAASTGQAQFRVTVAEATAGYDDDIAALRRLQRAILAQIRVEGHTADLETQLFQNRQDIAAKRLSQTTGREFRALGFTATGDQVTPTRRNLRRQLGQLRATLESSSLDSPKFEAELNRIRRTLNEALVPPEIRQRMQQMLADLRNQLKGHVGDVTRFEHVSSAALTRGLGLSPDVRRTLETRIAQAGAGGSVPKRGSAFALAAGGVTVNGGVHLHGVQNVRQMEDELAKRHRSRPAKRRG